MDDPSTSPPHPPQKETETDRSHRKKIACPWFTHSLDELGGILQISRGLGQVRPQCIERGTNVAQSLVHRLITRAPTGGVLTPRITHRLSHIRDRRERRMSDLYMYIYVYLCVCYCSVLPHVGSSHPASHTVCLIDVKQGVGYPFR
jgi:hypothetical protein